MEWGTEIVLPRMSVSVRRRLRALNGCVSGVCGNAEKVALLLFVSQFEYFWFDSDLGRPCWLGGGARRRPNTQLAGATISLTLLCATWSSAHNNAKTRANFTLTTTSNKLAERTKLCLPLYNARAQPLGCVVLCVGQQ